MGLVFIGEVETCLKLALEGPEDLTPEDEGRHFSPGMSTNIYLINPRFESLCMGRGRHDMT